MAVLKMIGDWLNKSGWVEAIIQANIASSGTAESFVKVSHVTRTRHAHQVTASSLYILLNNAYIQYLEGTQITDQVLLMDEWCVRRQQESPQFFFWYTALQLQKLALAYIRSLRNANFKLYIDCLTKLVPWCFALDHTNYARWLSVHIRDMANLSNTHPEIAFSFSMGKFTVQQTTRVFSSIAIDQAHEQNNATVKGDGGAIGLTQDEELLQRWTVAGPEVVRILSEFETSIYSTTVAEEETHHHEEAKRIQLNFSQQVKALVETVDEMGNPFADPSGDLYKLHSKEVADKEQVIAMREAQKIGKEQYDSFVTERLVEKKPISDPIKKKKLSLFSRPPAKEQAKSKQQISFPQK